MSKQLQLKALCTVHRQPKDGEQGPPGANGVGSYELKLPTNTVMFSLDDNGHVTGDTSQVLALSTSHANATIRTIAMQVNGVPAPPTYNGKVDITLGHSGTQATLTIATKPSEVYTDYRVVIALSTDLDVVGNETYPTDHKTLTVLFAKPGVPGPGGESAWTVAVQDLVFKTDEATGVVIQTSAQLWGYYGGNECQITAVSIPSGSVNVNFSPSAWIDNGAWVSITAWSYELYNNEGKRVNYRGVENDNYTTSIMDANEAANVVPSGGMVLHTVTAGTIPLKVSMRCDDKTITDYDVNVRFEVSAKGYCQRFIKDGGQFVSQITAVGNQLGQVQDDLNGVTANVTSQGTLINQNSERIDLQATRTAEATENMFPLQPYIGNTGWSKTASSGVSVSNSSRALRVVVSGRTGTTLKLTHSAVTGVVYPLRAISYKLRVSVVVPDGCTMALSSARLGVSINDLSSTTIEQSGTYSFTVTGSTPVASSVVELLFTFNGASTTSYQISDIRMSAVTETTGYVDVAAERVSMGVRNDLRRTGIDIEDGVITARTGTFRVLNDDNEQTFGVNEHGVVEANGGIFNGDLTAHTLTYSIVATSDVESGSLIYGGVNNNKYYLPGLPAGTFRSIRYFMYNNNSMSSAKQLETEDASVTLHVIAEGQAAWSTANTPYNFSGAGELLGVGTDSGAHWYMIPTQLATGNVLRPI